MLERKGKKEGRRKRKRKDYDKMGKNGNRGMENGEIGRKEKHNNKIRKRK
jgi:hypothetical protein